MTADAPDGIHRRMSVRRDETGAEPERSAGAVHAPGRERRLVDALGTRPVVLIGLMGAGKSTVGRRLALRLGLPFRDADTEIEEAAGMSIPDIFALFGEPYFRDGERRVIERLLREGAMVLATGGGAWMDEQTRRAVGEIGVSVWLEADLDTLMRRVRKRGTRPLLQNPDPEGTMRKLIDLRYPLYALADLSVKSQDVAHEEVVEAIVRALESHLGLAGVESPGAAS